MRALGLYREQAFGDNGGHQPIEDRGMKLVTYAPRSRARPAWRDRWRHGGRCAALGAAGRACPDTMLGLIDLGPAGLERCGRAGRMRWRLSPRGRDGRWPMSLLAPIPRPRKNIFGIGLNYVDHVAESAAALDTSPDLPASR
jgi:hypothetical protein